MKMSLEMLIFLLDYACALHHMISVRIKMINLLFSDADFGH